MLWFVSLILRIYEFSAFQLTHSH